MATMREFLSTGKLGEIRLGMTPEQVAAALGPADAHSPRRRPVYLVKYGAVELAFKPMGEPLTLASIAVHFGASEREIPAALRPADWVPTGGTSVDEFRRFVAETGIAMHADVWEEQETLLLDTGATAVFVHGRLHSIHFKGTSKKPERRQMTVSLPEQVVQQLRERAQEQHVSIHELVENLIKAKA
jgi:hypothetical protein